MRLSHTQVVITHVGVFVQLARARFRTGLVRHRAVGVCIDKADWTVIHSRGHLNSYAPPRLCSSCSRYTSLSDPRDSVSYRLGT